METQDNKEKNIWLVEDNQIFATGVERSIERMDGMKCGGNHRSVELALDAGAVTNPREGKKVFRGFTEE